MRVENKIDLLFLTIMAVCTLLLSGCASEKRFSCVQTTEYRDDKKIEHSPLCHEYTQLCWFSCRGY